MWTVSVLQMHKHGMIVCDDDATAELKVGTVRYFKDVERTNFQPVQLSGASIMGTCDTTA